MARCLRGPPGALGSRNVTAWEILDRQTGCYRPLAELRRKVGTALEAKEVITYCGAGAAASLANVLVRSGHPRVASYIRRRANGVVRRPQVATADRYVALQVVRSTTSPESLATARDRALRLHRSWPITGRNRHARSPAVTRY